MSDWWNWAYFCANFIKFWKYDPCLYQFLHWITGHLYTRRLILRPISAACPRIDLCTKNPPSPRYAYHYQTWCKSLQLLLQNEITNTLCATFKVIEKTVSIDFIILYLHFSIQYHLVILINYLSEPTEWPFVWAHCTDFDGNPIKYLEQNASYFLWNWC